MLSLIIASSRQIALEFHPDENDKSVFFRVLDRLTKLSALQLGMSLNFEKEILNMFMIF